MESETTTLVKIIDTNAFKKLIKNLSYHINECCLEFVRSGKPKKNYMRILHMDKNKSILIYLHLDGNIFEWPECIPHSLCSFEQHLSDCIPHSLCSFEQHLSDCIPHSLCSFEQHLSDCNQKKKIMIPIDLRHLLQLLDLFRDESVILYTIQTKSETLCLKSKSNTVLLEYHLPTTKLHKSIMPSSHLNISRLTSAEFSHKITLTSDYFYQICKCFKENDSVHISILDNYIQFAKWENYKLSNKILVSSLDFHNNNINHDENISEIFKIKKLLKIAKYGTPDKKVQICLKNNFPLTILTDIDTVGKLYFCVAPIDIKKISAPSLFEQCFKVLFKNSCPAEIIETTNKSFNGLPLAVSKITYNKIRPRLPYLEDM